MNPQKHSPSGRATTTGENTEQPQDTPPTLTGQETGTPLTQFLSRILEGHTHAQAMMPWGRPGPIRLPGDPGERAELVRAHLEGKPARVAYCPSGQGPKIMDLPALVLAALCPAHDGLCRWLAIDLDAADGHGSGGLVDPARAARYLAERADHAGLGGGMVVAKSRSGHERHLWLIPPGPVPLVDAVLAVAYLAAIAHQAATRDVDEGDVPHAFRRADATTALPGMSGAVELIPRSTSPPLLGWSLTLPGAGALAPHGGGVLVDPLHDVPKSGETPLPLSLSDIPRGDSAAWAAFLLEARRELHRRQPVAAGPSLRRRAERPRDALSRISPRTTTLIDGRVPQGSRNSELFAAACQLFAVADPHEATRLALKGAVACGLSEREARATIKSAAREKGIKNP